jgi:hypothetical protein
MEIRTTACRLIFLLATLYRVGLAQPQDYLVAPVDGRRTVNLPGSRNPRIKTLADEGPVDDSMRVRGIHFRFKPSAAQSAELAQLLEDQQNPNSPLFHSWLTPEEYSERFGLSMNDLMRVRIWLETQGFRIDAVARSRTWITFSATAAQVRDTFKTELHRYRANSRMHFANATEAQIPLDLVPIVQTLMGLDDFPFEHVSRLKPAYNISSTEHSLAPGDLATIYNVTPLYQKGFNGTGQKIVIAGQSDFNMADVQAYRSKFGLPKNDPQRVPVPGYDDPGINDDVGEAIIDVETVGASAPNATILFVYMPAVFGAVEYAIDENLAPIISSSYGACERNVTKANLAEAFRTLAQQANAQGITWLASSGDTGPAACETQDKDAAGLSGMQVNVPASLPEVTGVGGTEFAEGTGSYWSKTGDANLASAISYIPEVAWNDFAIDGLLATTSGGASALYPKPAWQTGPGVPDDSARHVPDIAFTASWDHDSYELFLNGKGAWAGGKSAATPYFAGILALLNQYLVSSGVQSKPGLGNINPKLYQLAQKTPGIFHDITSGDNIIPCKSGSPDCKTGSYGYQAGPGYDQATGLGSIDINNLFKSWASGPSGAGVVSTTTTAAASPAILLVSGSTNLTARVKAASGAALPTGSVEFSLGKTVLGTASLSDVGGTATAGLTVPGTQLVPGDDTITAAYSGASAFAPSSGSALVTVMAPSGSSAAIVPSAMPNPVYQQAPDDDGYAWYYTLRLAETAGISTTITAFSIDGTDYTSNISSWFGSKILRAHGTLSVALRAKDLTVPADLVYSFSGVDANGKTWTQQLTVRFLGAHGSAAMALTSTPEAVVLKPNGDPNCSADHPFFQTLNLTEKSGQDVKLTKFVAASTDMSDEIADWFGSARLPASGTLHANMCWQLDSLPATLEYEVDGVDGGGHTITATLQVDFEGPAQISSGSAAFSNSAGRSAPRLAHAKTGAPVSFPAMSLVQRSSAQKNSGRHARQNR